MIILGGGPRNQKYRPNNGQGAGMFSNHLCPGALNSHTVGLPRPGAWRKGTW